MSKKFGKYVDVDVDVHVDVTGWVQVWSGSGKILVM